VDQNVNDCDLAGFRTVPRSYRHRDAIAAILAQTGIFNPCEDHVVPHTFLVAFLLLRCGQQIQLLRVEPPHFVLTKAVIGLSPELVTITPNAFDVYLSASYRPESPVSGRVNEWLLIVRGCREYN
jgi:hypothetical protein